MFNDEIFPVVVELLLPFVQIVDLSNDTLTQILLPGEKKPFYDLNKNIIELTLRFIQEIVALTKIFQTTFMYKAATTSVNVSASFAL